MTAREEASSVSVCDECADQRLLTCGTALSLRCRKRGPVDAYVLNTSGWKQEVVYLFNDMRERISRRWLNLSTLLHPEGTVKNKEQ